MNSAITPLNIPRTDRWSLFGWFAVLFLVASQVEGIVTSPPDRDMGDLEKILYVHLPAALMTFGAFFVVFVFSIRYLWKGREQDDLLAASAAEVGTAFNGLTLIIGSIWARPTWGVWWAWEARLTSTLVLFLIFVSYLSLRAFVEDQHQRAQWSAAVGILGAINVPIVYMSVRWWRTLHQVQSSPQTVDSVFVLALRLNIIAFLFMMIYFVRRRYEAACLVRATEHALEASALAAPH